MATIVKTPSGTWKAVIRKHGWPTTAKTFRLKRDADDWARRTEDEMVRGVFIERTPSERLTVAMALKRYLDEVTPTKKASTQVAERTKAKPLFQYFGQYSLAAVTPDLIAHYRDDRLRTPSARSYAKPGEPTPTIKADTVRLELALLSHLFTIAIKEWQIGLPQNPVFNIRKPSPGKPRDRRISTVERDRLFALARDYSNPMLYWIIGIAYETGMRKGEITSLRRSDVDIRRRVVKLTDTKNGSSRLVPLTLQATEMFREALNHPLRPADTNLIFYGEPGRDGLRRPYMFGRMWRELCKKAKVHGFRIHDFRHEAVSRLVEFGLSDQEVSAISGHKSMQMLKRYTHLRAEDLVNKLDRVTKQRGSISTSEPSNAMKAQEPIRGD